MENDNTRTKSSFINIRNPSVDRRCRPLAKKYQVLKDLIEISDDDNISSDDEYESSPPVEETEDEITENTNSLLSTGITQSIATESEECEMVQTAPELPIQEQIEEALVYLRFRPVTDLDDNFQYKIEKDSLIIHDNIQQGGRKTEKIYKFSGIFDSNVEQNVIYEKCVRDKIHSEENLTVLTYGTSGSGKTFTLLGTKDNPGVVLRALENIFNYYERCICDIPGIQIKNTKLYILDENDISNQEEQRKLMLSNINDLHNSYSQIKSIIRNEHKFDSKTFNESQSVFIWISFVEIYNECIYDLLITEKKENNNEKRQINKDLKIITNQGKVFIKNLNSIYVKNSLEAFTVLTNGLQNVTYASTYINNHSSRSHCVLLVDIITYYNETHAFDQTLYKFCDLAGSERISKTGNSFGTRLKETQKINKSLLVLGRCLDISYQNQNRKTNDVVPYRESKLTTLLQAALIGKERLTMIVNIMPIEQYYDENLNVLKFAAIAKNIIYKTPNKSKKKTRLSWFVQRQQLQERQKHKLFAEEKICDSNYKEAYEKLLEENEILRNEIELLKKELVNQEIDLRRELCDQHDIMRTKLDQFWEQIISQKVKTLEKQFEHQESKLNRKIEKLEEEIEKLEEEYNELQVENGSLKRRLEIKASKNKDNNFRGRRFSWGFENEFDENQK